MKKTLLKSFIGISIFLALSCSDNKPKNVSGLYAEIDTNSAVNTLGKTEAKNGWVLLFDGKTGSGWHGYNMTVFPQCWSIEGGAFTMNSTGSTEDQDIITNRKYRNFALFLEYKLSLAANSGVIFQVSEDPKYKYPYETGPEFQVIDDANWPDSLQNWQKNGANYAMYPPKTNANKPIGEWNQLFLVVQGNHVTQLLNGHLMAEYEKNSEEWKNLRNSGKWVAYPDWGSFDEGFIALQNHGTRVWYRSIKMKEL